MSVLVRYQLALHIQVFDLKDKIVSQAFQELHQLIQH